MLTGRLSMRLKRSLMFVLFVVIRNIWLNGKGIMILKIVGLRKAIWVMLRS